MKRLILFCCVICLLALSCVPVWAGDIPETLGYDDDAKVFIGTLLSCFDSPLGGTSGAKDVTVLPVQKIKGDVQLEVDDTFEGCYFPNQEPKTGTEYLFGWLSNTEVYAYEVKARTENAITIHITDEFSQRIQNYLNEGLYERAEIERINVGGKITFAELLGTDLLYVEGVSFSLNDVTYDVNVGEFFALAEKIIITDVKNSALHRFGADDWEADILYITLNLKEGANGGGFAMITRYGEVDRYAQMMSRLPECDYEMAEEDLAKLYSFLPQDVQRELYGDDHQQGTESTIDIAAFVGVFLVVVLGCTTGVIMYRRKRK